MSERPECSDAPLIAGPLTAGALLAAAALGPASAETVVKGPNGLSIDCDDFCLYPNGTVEASKDATLVYTDQKGSFADATFGPKVFSSGGVDTGEWVNQSCGKKQALRRGAGGSSVARKTCNRRASIESPR